MPRQTLPDFDPLAELGIVSETDLAVHPRRRSPRRDTSPKPRVAPLHVDVLPPPSAAKPATNRPVESAAHLSQVSQSQKAQESSSSVDDPVMQGERQDRATVPQRALKAKTSGRIATALWEEVRDCVVWHGHFMTIDRFTEDAFREHLARLRKDHDLGERFPSRGQEPKQGRRIS